MRKVREKERESRPRRKVLLQHYLLGKESVKLAPSGHTGHLFGLFSEASMAYDLRNALFFCIMIHPIAITTIYDNHFVSFFSFFQSVLKQQKKIKSFIHTRPPHYNKLLTLL